jgi:hypothetical protein
VDSGHDRSLSARTGTVTARVFRNVGERLSPADFAVEKRGERNFLERMRA